MISLMLKLLTIVSLLSISLSARTAEEKIISYEKHRLRANPNIELKKQELVFKKELGNGWSGYVFSLDITIKAQNKDITVNDTLFSNGQFITSELKAMNGLDLKRKMHPILDARYYTDEHLIAGNKNAKHKLVVFSDPLCPICTTDTPRIIKDVQDNPDLFALYYISYPLEMHPTAMTIAKAAELLKERKFENAEYKVYTAGLDAYFDAYKSKDKQKSLDALNKVLGTNLTLKEINTVHISKKIKADIKLAQDAFVNGTPTLFLDGEVDLTRSQYQKYIK